MKFFLQSLGCDKTLVDSEHILGSVVAADIEITDNISIADIIAINTCCFIGDALEESINACIDAGNAKKSDASIIVFGCMAKRYYKDIQTDLPEVDLIIDSADPHEITIKLGEFLNKKLDEKKRFLTGIGSYSYLKIAEGCDKNCTYCVIPSIKGHYKSIPMDFLYKEACDLANRGVKELIIVAQETTLYGVDLYGQKSLHTLLHKLGKIEGITWIRLMYVYPEEIYDELIYEMRDNKKILHYIDMPIQHCNDEILRRMARRTKQSDIINIIFKLRKEIPDICLRTTIICGFPGESDSDFTELCDFIKRMKFDRLGAFSYSREEKTPAYDYNNQIEEDIKNNRRERIMQIQNEIANEASFALKGNILTCIVEGYMYDDDVYRARSYRDAPDVDGFVFFKSEKEHMSGDFVNILITETLGYDLIGEVVYESTE